jgi:hypothetical protein
MSLGLLLAAACAAGCTRYERVVHYRPPLSGIPGAQSATPFVSQGRTTKPADTTNSDNRIRIEHEDGRVELISRNSLQLLTHLRATLVNDEEELFTEQVLSQRTRSEFIARGYDPAEAFKELKRRERDVYALLARMPMAEFTPGLLLQNVERNTFRLRVTGVGVNRLAWRSVDMIVEEGQWRLRWFGE